MGKDVIAYRYIICRGGVVIHLKMDIGIYYLLF